jgi:hypothetical protein
MPSLLHYPISPQEPFTDPELDPVGEAILTRKLLEEPEEEVWSLYSSDPSANETLQAASELALCRILADWANNDIRLIDYMFRGSSVYTTQANWPEGNKTHLRRIIERAISENSKSAHRIAPEIVEGLIREGEILLLCGYYGIGKTPLMLDLACHVTNGIRWLHRSVFRRHVYLIDFETPVEILTANFNKILARYPGPRLRPQARLLRTAPGGDDSLDTHNAWTWEARLREVRSLLAQSPDALLIIDPIEHFFRLNRSKSPQLLHLFFELRQLLADFPNAAIIGVVNYGRRGRRRNQLSLLKDPFCWLEGNAGDLDLLNRCDVRLGFDSHDEPGYWVLNGVRRGESMTPVIVQQVNAPDGLSGFHAVNFNAEERLLTLTPRQLKHWGMLPNEFRFMDIVKRRIVPRGSLSRLIKVTKGLGLLESREGVHRKT